jgi:hypothetical protein
VTPNRAAILLAVHSIALRKNGLWLSQKTDRNHKSDRQHPQHFSPPSWNAFSWTNARLLQITCHPLDTPMSALGHLLRSISAFGRTFVRCYSNSGQTHKHSKDAVNEIGTETYMLYRF